MPLFCAIFGPVDTIIIVNKRFAEESHDLRDWITPSSWEVQALHEQLRGSTPDETLMNCWRWIESHFAYPLTVCGSPTDSHELIAFGRLHYLNRYDFWEFPSEAIAQANSAAKHGKMAYGDCETRAFLMVSVLRNQVSPSEVYAVLGNYYVGWRPAGHAWVRWLADSRWHTVDPTQPAGSLAGEANYDTYCIFNDVEAVEFKPLEEILGKTHDGAKIACLRGISR